MSPDSSDEAPRPTPARDARGGGSPPEPARPPEGRRGGRRGGRGKKKGHDRRPTPARLIDESRPSPKSVEARVTTLSLCRLEEPRTVRVMGASGGASPAAVPMLLLGFWPPDSDAPDPEKEAWAVARSLSDLTAEDLEALCARATAFKPREAAPPRPQRPRRRGGRRGGRGGSGGGAGRDHGR